MIANPLLIEVDDVFSHARTLSHSLKQEETPYKPELL
jgi:hypothetical protein